ncbi:MAG: hypothetical protein HZB15_03885 [Actinobacteria bacterium]|nr:hypothetical protein [Actinomycetota bacterium]
MKTGLASVGEQLGLLKLNGRVVSRSPLSTIVELEALQMVVREKRSLWETLQQLPSAALSTDLDALIARADDQLAQLTDLHRARVSTTFIPSVAPTRP